MTTERATELRDALADIVGAKHVLAGEQASRFAGDALGAGRGSIEFAVANASDVVGVQPSETEEVARIVRLANEQRVAIVPHGGGSGLMGGAMSLQPSIVIDTARLSVEQSVRMILAEIPTDL